MLELMIVVSILLVITAIAVYNVQPAIRAVRLHGAASDYADLLQNARIRAVKDDKYYAILTNPGANPPIAFVDINGNGAYDLGEPMMEFRSNTTPAQFSSGPSLANLESQFLPQNGIGSLVTTAAGPTFGPRGLPCTPTPAVNGSTTCPYITPTSFVTFLQDSQGTWAAVTVTPAARIRVWSYTPSTGNWSSSD
jgi:Tfp pilus assembly protein FimT